MQQRQGQVMQQRWPDIQRPARRKLHSRSREPGWRVEFYARLGEDAQSRGKR